MNGIFGTRSPTHLIAIGTRFGDNDNNNNTNNYTHINGSSLNWKQRDNNMNSNDYNYGEIIIVDGITKESAHVQDRMDLILNTSLTTLTVATTELKINMDITVSHLINMHTR